MLNSVQLVGRIARDAAVFDKDDTKSAIVTVAVERNYLVDGKRPVDYIEFKVFGKTDKPGVIPHLTKGQLISVEAEIRTNNYEKNGETVYVQEVVAQPNGIQLLARPKAK